MAGSGHDPGTTAGYTAIPFTVAPRDRRCRRPRHQGQLNIVAVLTVAAKGNEPALLDFQARE